MLRNRNATWIPIDSANLEDFSRLNVDHLRDITVGVYSINFDLLIAYMTIDELGENDQDEELIAGPYCICNWVPGCWAATVSLHLYYGTCVMRDMNLKFGTFRLTFFIALLNYGNITQPGYCLNGRNWIAQ